MTDSYPVDPDSVRVWCGYRHHSMHVKDFQDKLGEVFIPACVKLQTNLGLTAYIPTVLLGIRNKESFVPDETALVFYKSQETYRACFNTLAERIYALDHHGVFSFEKNEYEFQSYSEFPKLFTGSLEFKKPVYLFDKKTDWMNGKSKHFVGTRDSKMPPAEFQENISKIISTIQKNEKLDGAIACIDSDYLVYWELISNEQTENNLSIGIPLLEKAFKEWKQSFTAKDMSLPKGLWDNWEGITNIDAGSCLNMVFDRKPD